VRKMNTSSLALHPARFRDSVKSNGAPATSLTRITKNL
jgi:hypothetical protein